MSGLTYARFFPSDWRSGCMALNLEEEGLYIRCCSFMWDTGQPIPGDDTTASRLLHVHINKYRKVMSSLIEKGKMIRAQGCIVNERVLDEIDAYRAQASKRSNFGKRGGEARARNASYMAELEREIQSLRESLKRVSESATPQSTPPVTPLVAGGVTPPVTPPVTHGVEAKKANKINEGQSDLLKQNSSQVQANPEARSQNKESMSETDVSNVVKKSSYTKAFEEFWSGYLSPAERRSMSKKSAFERWKSLSADDRRDAVLALPAFCADFDNRRAKLPDATPLHAERYLSKRRFETLLEDANSEFPTDEVDGKRWGWWKGKEDTLRNLHVDRWRAAFKVSRPNGTWPWWKFGPPPGADDCLVPDELVEEHGWGEIYQGQVKHV